MPSITERLARCATSLGMSVALTETVKAAISSVMGWELLSVVILTPGNGANSRGHSPLASDCETRRKSHGLLECTGGRPALAHDVERRAMRRRREHGRKSRCHRDAAIEALELRGDLALVVIHREHAVEVTCKRLEKHGIGGIRSLARDATRGGICDGGCDEVDLFPTEETVLSSVRIQCTHRDARPIEAGAAHGA